MKESNAAAATLSSWYIYDAANRKFGFADPEAYFTDDVAQELGWPSSQLQDEKETVLYGFGFSYVYYREAAITNPYFDTKWGEDKLFFWQLRSSGHVHLLYDHAGICLHTVHSESTSSCGATREVSEDELPTLDIAAIPEFAFLLNNLTDKLS